MSKQALHFTREEVIQKLIREMPGLTEDEADEGLNAFVRVMSDILEEQSRLGRRNLGILIRDRETVKVVTVPVDLDLTPLLT
ncbi:hypothetical protein MYX07_06455 [Patescibacteria group bacterium AH-259-L07]|nr:hypothetical protein [Patescibacteria group bacterium AH-259-L07]